MMLPFECTEDGTVFVGMFDPAPVVNFQDLSGRFLAAIPRSGEVQKYRLAEAPGLYDIQERSHSVSSSGLFFLVRASPDSKPEQPTAAVYHDYLVAFDRSGQYRGKMQIQDDFRASEVGVLESGNILIYGFAEADHAPKLAFFKDDGTLLRMLRPARGAMRKSALSKGPGNADSANVDSGVYVVAPVQLVPQKSSVFVLQRGADLPLLEVKEGGGVRALYPRLPPNTKFDRIVVSNRDLYLHVSSGKRSFIYQIDPLSGEVLKRFRVDSDESGNNVACVYDGEFLSFAHDWEHGRFLIPLLGTEASAK
jgi:hypothetical protein